jgi:hypothetical protein
MPEVETNPTDVDRLKLLQARAKQESTNRIFVSVLSDAARFGWQMRHVIYSLGCGATLDGNRDDLLKWVDGLSLSSFTVNSEANRA